MKNVIFMLSLLGFGFIAGRASMWVEWNESSKNIEVAPYAYGFDRLPWTVKALGNGTQRVNEDATLIDFNKQVEGVGEFLSDLKAERMEERRPSIFYGQAILVILGFVTFFTRPKAKS